MAFLHFPAALTGEEEALKKALIQLKKKKKMLQSLKAAAQNKEKEEAHSKSTGKQAPPPSSFGSAGKATEQAKKLVQSGAIKVAELKERSGFKRSKNFEKKMKDVDITKTSATPVGFQPFHAFSGEDEEDRPPSSKRVKGLSESFVSAGYNNNNSRDGGRDRDRDNRGDRGDFNDRPERDFRDRGERDYRDRGEREYREPPKKGNTIYIHGQGITEEMLRKFFSRFGKILNISMETDRNNAFITFEKMDSADQAISEANEALVNHIKLRVQMARRQRPIDTINDGASSVSSWVSIAASTSQKGTSQKSSRDLMTYDAGDLF